MKAIIARVGANGKLATVGTLDQTVVSHYKTLQGVRRYARKYARYGLHRIEFFADENFYGDPFRVETHTH